MRARLFTFVVLTSLSAGAGQAVAQSWHADKAVQKPVLRNQGIRTAAPPAAEKRTAATGPDRAAFIDVSDVMFPHLAIGGFWETEIVIVNLGSTAVTFDQYFYDQAGNPMEVTIKSIPDGQTETGEMISGAVLQPGHRFTFLLTSSDPETKVGWSFLDYNPAQRLGGYAIFRSFNVPGRLDQEATVPLSSYEDYFFFQTFDNLNGLVTSMALVNPSDSLTNNVTATVRDQAGAVLETKTFALAPGEHKVFETINFFESTRNQIGTIVFDSTINRLSAVGLRFSPQGAFTTVSPLNWAGNFQ